MAITKDHRTIEDLRRRGFAVTPGNKYIPSSRLPKKTISIREVRRRLSKIKGNLSDTISEMRDAE